jgi:hypothetical protein
MVANFYLKQFSSNIQEDSWIMITFFALWYLKCHYFCNDIFLFPRGLCGIRAVNCSKWERMRLKIHKFYTSFKYTFFSLLILLLWSDWGRCPHVPKSLSVLQAHNRADNKFLTWHEHFRAAFLKILPWGNTWNHFQISRNTCIKISTKVGSGFNINTSCKVTSISAIYNTKIYWQHWIVRFFFFFWTMRL